MPVRSGSRAADGGGCVQRPILRVRDGRRQATEDWIAQETAVALVYNGEPHAVMMATPRDLEDFALGFSLTEDIVERPDELLDVDVLPVERGLQLSLRIAPARAQALAGRGRSMVGRTGCGLCGARAIEDAIRPLRRVVAGDVVTETALQRALQGLREHQRINARTGAVHAAAWAAPDGRIRALREDVGRHNALDKLVGAMARNNRRSPGFLVTTSRASYEIVQKAAHLGAGLVAAISAPTALAVDLAEEAGITLVGFARESGCVIYSAPARLQRGRLPAMAQ